MGNEDLKAVEILRKAKEDIFAEMEKIIVGQKDVIEQILICLFSCGHCFLIGVPGLAKTLIVRSLAEILDLEFKRIQFTPDLMPADITGTEVIEETPRTKQRNFRFVKGPLFANIILADEINRTPPKTQAALLEAMQEYRVTAGGNVYPLDLPFFVLATQNPIEFEGTYPLPEAQLDRFMFNVEITYPSSEEEKKIVLTTTSGYQPELKKVINGEEILKIQEVVRKVPLAEPVLEFIVNLVRSTRPDDPLAPDFVRKQVQWGASPRAEQYLSLGGKARALLENRYNVSREDVLTLAKPVLRHRIIPNYRAEAEGINSSKIIEKLLEHLKEK